MGFPSPAGRRWPEGPDEGSSGPRPLIPPIQVSSQHAAQDSQDVAKDESRRAVTLDDGPKSSLRVKNTKSEVERCCQNSCCRCMENVSRSKLATDPPTARDSENKTSGNDEGNESG